MSANSSGLQMLDRRSLKLTRTGRRPPAEWPATTGHAGTASRVAQGRVTR